MSAVYALTLMGVDEHESVHVRNGSGLARIKCPPKTGHPMSWTFFDGGDNAHP